MAHRPRLLEQALDDIAAGRRTVDECIEHYAADDPELADMLRLATKLGDACVPAIGAAAMQGVRSRVRPRLLAEVEQDDQTAQTAVTAGADTKIVTFPGRRSPQRRDSMPGWMRAACALAAALLLSLSSGWLVTYAAQGALPESPLYSVKRGEEWVALRTAWSDARRGEVLASIAAHRLAEASAEAALHHDAAAHALVAELDADMRQLISLTATMMARHEDTAAVEAALARDLTAEYAAIQSAQGSGLSSFAQELGATTLSQLADIQKDQLHVSAPVGNQPATSGGNGSAGHNGATPPGQSGTQGGQGPGGSTGQGGGNGGNGGTGGNGGNGGHGAPHPTPTPAPTLTPSATPPQHATPAGQARATQANATQTQANTSRNPSPARNASTSGNANLMGNEDPSERKNPLEQALPAERENPAGQANFPAKTCSS